MFEPNLNFLHKHLRKLLSIEKAAGTHLGKCTAEISCQKRHFSDEIKQSRVLDNLCLIWTSKSILKVKSNSFGPKKFFGVL